MSGPYVNGANFPKGSGLEHNLHPLGRELEAFLPDFFLRRPIRIKSEVGVIQMEGLSRARAGSFRAL